MYEAFLAKNSACTPHPVGDAILAQYRDVAPEGLIALWKEAGFGLFCDGLFRIIDPAEFQDYTDEHCREPFDRIVLPFLVTAFGDLFIYAENSVIGDYVIYRNSRYGTEKILSSNMPILFNKCLFNKSILTSWFQVER